VSSYGSSHWITDSETLQLVATVDDTGRRVLARSETAVTGTRLGAPTHPPGFRSEAVIPRPGSLANVHAMSATHHHLSVRRLDDFPAGNEGAFSLPPVPREPHAGERHAVIGWVDPGVGEVLSARVELPLVAGAKSHADLDDFVELKLATEVAIAVYRLLRYPTDPEAKVDERTEAADALPFPAQNAGGSENPHRVVRQVMLSALKFADADEDVGSQRTR